jgi:hypothetical protein
MNQPQKKKWIKKIKGSLGINSKLIRSEWWNNKKWTVS